MSGTSGKPPTKPPANKGFLGDDDLFSELDAWDATFDALHSEPDAGTPAGESVMKWPTPAPVVAAPVPAPIAPPIAIATPAPARNDAPTRPPAISAADALAASAAAAVSILDDDASASRTIDDSAHVAYEPEAVDAGELVVDDAPAHVIAAPITHDRPVQIGARYVDPADDDVGTFDRGYGHERNLPPPPPLPRMSTNTAIDDRSDEVLDPAETDFSQLGIEGQPAALGDLLGRPPTQPPIDEDAATRLHRANLSGPVRRPLSSPTVASTAPETLEEDVFTSASRPRGASFVDDLSLEDDPLAPPPPPAADVRRTPAIVRRTSGAVAVPRAQSPSLTPPGGVSAFSEDTRIADPESGLGMPAYVEEDDYADIEIGADAHAEPAAPSAAPEPAIDAGSQPLGRRTAHVLRRETPTRPPPLSGTPPELSPMSGEIGEHGHGAHDQEDASLEIEIVGERTPHAAPLAPPPAPPPVRASVSAARASDRDDEHDFSDVAESMSADYREPSRPIARPSMPVMPSMPATPSAPVAVVRSPIDHKLDDLLDDLAAPADVNTRRTGEGEAVDPVALGLVPPRAETDLPIEIAVDDSDDDDDAFGHDAANETIQISAPPPPMRRAALPNLPPAPQTPMPPVVGPTPAMPPPSELYARVKTPTSVPPLGGFPGVGQQLGPAAKTLIAAPASSSGAAAKTLMDLGGPPPPRAAIETPTLAALAEPASEAEVEPGLELETLATAWPDQLAPLPPHALDESAATALLIYERELATVDDSASSAALRVEAGRLSETLADLDRARTHYDAALLADPRATPALRGLRRIARASGDLVEATRHLDAEIAVAGALERRPLGHYRVDLLMASGDQDLARVAVGEILDTAPSDVRALLAQLELAFLDGRADEFGHALEQLAHAVADPQLRSSVQSARAVLAALGDASVAASWFAAAAESDPGSLAARLGAVRHATAHGDGAAAARVLLDLGKQVEASDPLTAAAFAVRAQQWAAGEVGATAAALALAVMPNDPLVARLAVETALAQLALTTTEAMPEAAIAAADALAHWASCAGAPTERAYAAAHAAELAPARGAELWGIVLQLDAGDDYAAAQLRTAYVAGEQPQAAIDVDLAVGADGERERARLRAAYGLIGQGQLGAAIDNLREARTLRPGSLALAEALAEALAADGRWQERAKLAAELAAEPGEQLDRDVAQLRSALAWEEAVGAAAPAPTGDADADAAAIARAAADSQRATAAALGAWERVLEHSPSAAPAHAGAIVLAARLGDREVLGEVLARAQAAERAPWPTASLALRRARLVAVDDPARAESILRELGTTAAGALDDPRRTVALMLAAARRGELGDAAVALDERAVLLDTGDHAQPEIAAIRLRAAQLALDAGDASRATALLGQVEHALPQLGVVPDLLAAARRRAGDRPTASLATRRDATPTTAGGSSDAFARLVRDADLAATHGDGAGAVLLYQRALELRPGDPIAAVPLIRVATQLGDAGPVAALALAQLRAAETSGDQIAKAEAYELLAHIDGELRNDLGSAQIALESAAQADPSRLDLLHRLERAYAAADQIGELLRIRRAELDAAGDSDVHKGDRAALLVDVAGLAARDQRPDTEVADHYRAALAAAPRSRQALLHLEQMIRRAGASAELASLEAGIADYFEGDARTQATFLTRAGETLAELGQIDAAVQNFGKADHVLPGHVPALEGWRQAALKGELWIDVAEAATRQASITNDATARNALHHLAGVALMDKALVGDRAMESFRRALDAVPGDRDSFLRLRILLEEDANHDDLALLLARRLAVETDQPAKIELHRALAELHRNFLSDRDTAKEHYRAILADDANDLRSHAAIADIAWEQGAWQEAADALVARARLERAPDVLKTLCYRLGLIYADRLVDVPMALKAFQRALTYQPDDENTLVRLADLATTAGEWKLALGACERLVKHETDPDRRAAHLHRVARIFKTGFGDAKRAERALQLALDGAPTNDDALAQLVQFYRDAGDITSVRVHLGRVAGAMRARAANDPKDGLAYRVIARAMAARAAAGVEGSLPIARVAAELAELFGTSGDPETKLLATPAQPDLSLIQRPEADEVLFPRTVPPELRQIFQLLGDRVAKHVGVDLRPYGATRGDRLRARDNPVASVAQSVATALGFGEIDVYLSTRQPWAMVAEPTNPVSLVIGASIGAAGGDAVRFAAGSALKLAQASLAIPARLAADELGVLSIALLRLFQPEFPVVGVDLEAVTAQTQKLRRLIPTGLFNELRPFALGIDGSRFSHRQLALDLRIAGLRAGLVASGSLLAGLRLLAAQAEQPLDAFVSDPAAQGLISFALSEDLAAVAR